MQELTDAEDLDRFGGEAGSPQEPTLIGFESIARFIGHRIILRYSRPSHLDHFDPATGAVNFSESYLEDDEPEHRGQAGTFVGVELGRNYDPKKRYSIRYIVSLSQGNGPALRIPLCEGDLVFVIGYDNNNFLKTSPLNDAHGLTIHRKGR